MTKYQVAINHDNEIGLADIVPQCHSRGIEFTETHRAPTGAIYQQGPFVKLEFNVLEGSAQYLAVLTQFGLHNADYKNVTVKIRDQRWQWVNKNGVAQIPVIGESADWERYFPRGIFILITNLEAPA